jgi:hypothetical protein
MFRFTRNFSRQYVGLIAVLFVGFALVFADSAESAQNSKNKAKAAPTPKKNAKATPKKNEKNARAKATPTPQKNAKEKTTSAKNSASKSDKNKDRNSSKSNSKTTSKNSKETKKSSSASNKTNAKNAKANDKSSSKRDSARKESSNRTSAKNDSKKDSSKKRTGVARETRTTTRSTAPKTASTKTPARTNDETPVDANLPQIIVTDVAARLRNQARANAAEVSRVRLGTILRVTEKNPAWYRVQYADGGKTANGWISANAVHDLNSGERAEVYRQIVERNYKAEMDFQSAAELVDFMTRAGGELEKSDAAAEMELKRLVLMRETLRKIPAGRGDEPPYREFLKAHEKSVVYNEPAGEWIVVSNQFWDLHKKYQPARIADQIAWEAAQNPLPGECEGYVNCYLFYLRMTTGEYLRLHPQGAKSADALRDLTGFLEPIAADAAQKKVYQGPVDVTDRAEFNNLIAELRTIVSRLPQSEKDKPLRQLREIAEAFR